MVAKSAIQTLKAEIAAYLYPQKCGVSIPGGAEMMSHLVQMYTEQNPQHVVVKLVAKNAFNSVSRRVFLEELNLQFPQLFPFFSQCYLHPVPLTTTLEGKPYSIVSKEGVQQGDPLGPFLFSLALQPILVKAREENPSVLYPSYLDDITLLGPISEVTVM